MKLQNNMYDQTHSAQQQYTQSCIQNNRFEKGCMYMGPLLSSLIRCYNICLDTMFAHITGSVATV